jgi:hypothetical protein
MHQEKTRFGGFFLLACRYRASSRVVVMRRRIRATRLELLPLTAAAPNTRA